VPASGRIVPVTLVHGADGLPYLRLEPVLTADYDDGIVTWHLTTQEMSRAR
jgi:hypothetical protein